MEGTLEDRITLKDGRVLGYAEYGDPTGVPVLHLHGSQSSRLEGSFPEFDAVAKQMAVRLIVPDRPGMGFSDFKRGRTLLEWPDDVAELATALGLDGIVVVGYSCGGPYAAACAYRIPARLLATGIISGVGPLHVPGALDGMGRSDRLQVRLAAHAPWLLRPLLAFTALSVRQQPEKTYAQFKAGLPEPDREVLSRAELKERILDTAHCAYGKSAAGVTWDTALTFQDWGFKLSDITIPVHLWHGEKDTIAPVAMGRYVAQSIPRCHAEFTADDGHFSLLVDRYEQILRTLVSSAQSEAPWRSPSH